MPYDVIIEQTKSLTFDLLTLTLIFDFDLDIEKFEKNTKIKFEKKKLKKFFGKKVEKKFLKVKVKVKRSKGQGQKVKGQTLCLFFYDVINTHSINSIYY